MEPAASLRPALPLKVLGLLSLRYWRRRLGRATAGVVGIALGVALVVSVVAVNRAVLRTYTDWVETLAGTGLVEVRAIESGGLAARLADLVTSVPGVEAAGGVVEQRSYIFTSERQAATTIRGVDAADAVRSRRRLAAGRRLDSADLTSTVLSAGAARALDVGIGGSVSLLSAEGLLELTVVGVEAGVDLAAPSRDRIALIPLVTAQNAFMQGRDVVTQIDVRPTNVSDLRSLRERLADQVGPGAVIRLPSDELQDLANATAGLRSLLLLAATMALVAAVFLIGNNLAAGSEERAHDLGVIRALGLPARVGALWFLAEAALLGALGSVLGGALGMVGAGSLMRRLPAELLLAAEGPALDVGLDFGAALGGAAVGLAVTLCVALPVAWRVVRRPARSASWALASRGRLPRALGPFSGVASPLAAASLLVLLLATVLVTFRSGWWTGDAGLHAAGSQQTMLLLLLVPATSVALAASLPGLFGGLSEGVRSLAAPPLWLRLATDNLRRHARRTGATAASLSITLASMVGVYGAADSYHRSLGEWLDASVNWDLLVTSGSQNGSLTQPLPASSLLQLAAVPGVLELLPERSVTVSAGGRAVELVAFDSAVEAASRRLRVVEALDDSAILRALRTEEGIALSLAVAARFEVGQGDRLALSTPSGERSFPVVALVEDAAAESTGAYMDRAVYAEAFGDPLVDEIGVLLEPGAEATTRIPLLAAAVRAQFGGRYPVQVIGAGAYRQEVLDGLTAVFAVIRALVMLAVVVALAGLLNAILIGLWQLRKQFALLRALGAPTAMMMRTIATEALLTTVAGAATGLLLGTILSVAVLRGLTPAAGPLPTWTPPFAAYLNALLMLLAAVVCGASLVVGRGRVRRSAAPVRADRP